MAEQYLKTWAAIDAAIKNSDALSEYPTISRIADYMRQYPRDIELLDWNLVCCVGNEMIDDLKAPIWNAVIDVWHEERSVESLADWNKANKVARNIKSDKEVSNVDR